MMFIRARATDADFTSYVNIAYVSEIIRQPGAPTILMSADMRQFHPVNETDVDTLLGVASADPQADAALDAAEASVAGKTGVLAG